MLYKSVIKSQGLNLGQVVESSKLEYSRDGGDFRWEVKCVEK